MLIDRTYFVGDIDIPNTDKAPGETLDWFIEKYEDDFLKKALGYQMYKNFKAGLLEDPVPDKWRTLLEGVEYTNLSSKLTYWPGLVSIPLSVINAVTASGTTIIVVGRGNAYDPTDGSATTTIPPSLVGKDFTFHQRLIGELRPDEYSIDGNELTLTGGVFTQDDTYFFKASSLAINASTGLNKTSPIANYVYYWYMRAHSTQTSGTGEVKTSNENSVLSNPGFKMQRAWNEMRENLCQLKEYLRANRELYDYEDHSSELFDTVNTFNL